MWNASSLSNRRSTTYDRIPNRTKCNLAFKLETSAILQVISIKSLQDYTTVIHPDDNGTFVAYVPGIPSCQAWGRTPDEARTELLYVFEMIQEEYAEQARSRFHQ